MEKSNSKNYLKQGMILAAASIIAKIIGMIYRIPLTRILGDEGNSYYSTANEIYNIILMISTFSLPLAISKLVAERLQKGEIRNSQRIFRCAIRFGVIAGGIMSLMTYFGAQLITGKIMNVGNAAFALRVLAPAIFIYAIVGCYRGFFQGHSNMIPTSVSQLIEQIVNAFVTVYCAGMMFKLGASIGEVNNEPSIGPAYGAAGGTFGTVVSITIAMLFLMFIYWGYYRATRRKIRNDKISGPLSDRTIYRALIFTIIPIVLSTLVYNLTTIVDQGIFNSVMKASGQTEATYSAVWGIYTGKFRVLMNVPLSLASCLAPSVVPALTAAKTTGDWKSCRDKVGESMRLTMVITIPCAVGLGVLASPIMQMLFSDARPMTAKIMQIGIPVIIFYAISTLSTGILQGLDHLRIPLISSVVALLVHLIALQIMLRSTDMGIYAVVVANIVFAVVVCAINAFAIGKVLHFRQEYLRTFIIPTISSVVMGAAVWVVYRVLHFVLGNVISCVFSIAVGMAVYGCILIKMGGLTEREIRSFPKGNQIVKLCHRLRLL